MKPYPLLFPIVLSSCGLYQPEFDCPVPIGVPCTSQTELESMICETAHGPDFFVPYQQAIPCICNLSEPTGRRIWIVRHREGGHIVEGHYIYERIEE